MVIQPESSASASPTGSGTYPFRMAPAEADLMHPPNGPLSGADGSVRCSAMVNFYGNSGGFSGEWPRAWRRLRNGSHEEAPIICGGTATSRTFMENEGEIIVPSPSPLYSKFQTPSLKSHGKRLSCHLPAVKQTKGTLFHHRPSTQNPLRFFVRLFDRSRCVGNGYP
jgi:hypothetical protein